MRSFYVYVRTLDNQFFSSSIAADNEANLCMLAYKRFREIGNPLPEAQFIRTMRFVADPRNEFDVAEYSKSCERGSPTDSGYTAYAELTPDTPRS